MVFSGIVGHASFFSPVNYPKVAPLSYGGKGAGHDFGRLRAGCSPMVAAQEARHGMARVKDSQAAAPAGAETSVEFPSGWRRWPLMKRLIPSVRKAWAALLWRDGQGVVRRDGALFKVNVRQWLGKSMVTHGAPERAQLSFLLANIASRSCTLFIDIGANFGIYSIFVAQRTNCGRIVAFEPDRRSYDQLLENLRLNGLAGRVETHPVAVSDRTGEVPFEFGPDTHNVLSKVGSAGAGAHSVVSARLDDVIAVQGERIALKIDIEGHELVALEGMRALLKNNKCFAQIECFLHNAPGFIVAMEKCGYKFLRRIERDHYFANF